MIRAQTIVLSASLLTLVACGSAGAGGGASGEPSEAQMKEAMLYAMNHPPGIQNSEPITIRFFKKEPATIRRQWATTAGSMSRCSLRNIGASM